MQKDLVHDLEIISTYCGQFTLSKAAHEFGVKWYEDHYSNTTSDLANSRFAGYLARKQTHIHKLAMVLSVADNASDPLVISQEHLAQASEITTALEADMPRVFSQIGLIGITKYADDVLQYLRTNREVGKRDLARYTFNLMGPDELAKSVESLLTAGYVQVKNIEGEITYLYSGPE
jgi:hypothetical protein